MHHTVLVHIVQCVADAQSDVDGPVDRQPAVLIPFLLVQDRPQQPSLHPLDHHVKPAAILSVVGFYHAGVVQLLADLLLPLEALHQDRVHLQLRMGNLDSHLLSARQIGGLEERRHPAARNHRIQAVVVQRISGFERRYEFVLHCNSILSCKS